MENTTIKYLASAAIVFASFTVPSMLHAQDTTSMHNSSMMSNTKSSRHMGDSSMHKMKNSNMQMKHKSGAQSDSTNTNQQPAGPGNTGNPSNPPQKK